MSRLLLAIIVVFLPLSHASFMPRELGGISGASPINLLWLMAFFYMLFASIKRGANTPKTDFFTLPIIFFAVLYTIAFLRSVLDIHSIAPYIKANQPNATWLILNKFLKPIQFMLTGWIIAKYCATTKNLDTVKNTLLVLPCLILPLVLIYYFFGSSMPTAGIDDPSYYAGRDMVSGSIGMHANALGGLAVILLGAILSNRDVQWKKFRYISIACCLGIVIASLSRMAFVTTLVLILFEFRHMNSKEKSMLITIMAILILSTSALLLNRMQYGMSNGPEASENKLNQVSAGRIEGIWKPSIPQFINNPFFGAGLLSIWKGPANKRMMLPNHPHNAYFEILLDMGVVGFMSLIAVILSLWSKSKKSRALRLGLLAWLCMALTGNSFYPYFHNMIIWVIYGLACAEASLYSMQEAKEVKENGTKRPCTVARQPREQYYHA